MNKKRFLLAAMTLIATISFAQTRENSNPYAIFGGEPLIIGAQYDQNSVFVVENISEIVFKDIGGGMIIYDENLGDWVIGFRPPSVRFIVDSISAGYIKDSLKLLPSDLNYVDNTIVDDGTEVEWMVVYDNGTLYEGNYKTPTENYARLADYLLGLTQRQHSDSLTIEYVSKLRRRLMALI